jgi:lipoyl(octanoyl) transferase
MKLDHQWLGRISWQDAYTLQEKLVEKRLSGEVPDTVLLLEHKPVITIGRTPDRSSLQLAETSGIPVIETNRGGQATYHGPGQLVGYLILDLTALGRDLHHYLRLVEQSVIDLCVDQGLAAHRREALTGVWMQQRKLASIGVGVRKWVSMHGFALNVTTESLVGFQPIVPCGIQGVEMTCLQSELTRNVTVEAVAERYRLTHLIDKTPTTATL